MAQENTQKPSRLFVELDALLDTRLGTLMIMGDKEVEAAFKHGYYDRFSDYFEGVDYEAFKDIYKNRDKRILKSSLMTPIGRLIKDFVLTTLHNVNNTPFHLKPVVLVNLYPYNLTDNEANNIIQGLVSLTLGLCDIETVSLSPAQLTPLYLKSNLAIVIMYEYDTWLEEHAKTEAWKKHTAPDVTVLAPNISMTKLKSLPHDFNDHLDAMQEVAAPFVNLKLIAIENFCLSLKPKDFEDYRNKKTANT
jgi:hypothetical protein